MRRRSKSERATNPATSASSDPVKLRRLDRAPRRRPWLSRATQARFRRHPAWSARARPARAKEKRAVANRPPPPAGAEHHPRPRGRPARDQPGPTRLREGPLGLRLRDRSSRQPRRPGHPLTREFAPAFQAPVLTSPRRPGRLPPRHRSPPGPPTAQPRPHGKAKDEHLRRKRSVLRSESTRQFAHDSGTGNKTFRFVTAPRFCP